MFDASRAVRPTPSLKFPQNLWRDWKRDHPEARGTEQPLPNFDPLEFNVIYQCPKVRLVVCAAEVFTYVGVSRLYSGLWAEQGIFADPDKIRPLLVAVRMDELLIEACADEGIFVSLRQGANLWRDWSMFNSWSEA